MRVVHTRYRTNPSDTAGMGLAMLGVALAAGACVGVFLLSRNPAAAAKNGPTPPPAVPSLPELIPGFRPPGLPSTPDLPVIPIGLMPDLKRGDTVLVDTAEANIPADRGGAVPFLICTVDGLLTDPVVVAVTAVVGTFSGTIVRSAIKKRLNAANLLDFQV